MNIELQGVQLALHDLGAGLFSLQTYGASGGAGVADQSIELQGYRIEAHDNGDGTFSPSITATNGAGVNVEWQGLLLKLVDTGRTLVIGGETHKLYAILTFAT